ncbi:MAG: DUF2357 domain-containing protein [Planctomycetaceae bacterium]|jgi:hypothetical protein|nr:DUF2357 domain-containing protein [Planctomycetaceae bacterium]
MFETLESVYKSTDASEITDALVLIQLRDWFTFVCEFDPLTCEPISTGTDELFAKILQYDDATNNIQDRLGRVLEHTHEALKNILLEIKTQILREHITLPVYAVRETDSKSIQWIARKTGRTIREKLSGNPYLLAVNKRMSANISENRLLKVFVDRFEYFVQLRNEFVARTKTQDKYTEVIDDLLGLIQRWKSGDEYDEIGEWKNPPPNNTLLENRNYRKILDAWNWLNTIDDDVVKDFWRMDRDTTTMLVCQILAELSDLQNVRILQFPVQPQYDNFSFDDLTGVIGVNLATNENITYQKEKDNIIISCGQNEKMFPLESKVKASTIFQNSDIITSIHIKAIIGNTEKKSGITLPNFTGKHAVIDLCSVRPSLVIDKNAEIDLSFRLLVQLYVMKEGEQLLDCKNSTAVMLRQDNTTIGMSELFLNKTDISIAKKSHAKSQAAKLFCKTLKENINTQKLTYLLPDCVDDFEIETLRRSINFYFPDVEPLPRSIAAVLAWQSSETFSQYKIQPDDTILVMENVGEHFCVSRIVCKKDKQLAKDIPQTLGFYWERHPILEFDSPFFPVVKKILAESSSADIADILLNLFTQEDLIVEAGKLSFYSADLQQWIHIENIDILIKKIKQNLSVGNFQNFIEQFNDSINGLKRIHILQFGNFQIPQNIFSNKKIRFINFEDSILHGGIVHEQWSAKTEQPLWKDHLPNLSLRAGMQSIDLVKNETLIPQRKKTINIPVRAKFGLPKNQKTMRFELIQGDKKSGQQFEAYLQSKHFPLHQDVECELKMTFTYGADNPYELKFVPLNPQQAGFQSVTAEWRYVDKNREEDIDSLPVPEFPKCYTWEELQNFKGEKRGVSNLLEWIESSIERLFTSPKRYCETITTNWKESIDKKGKTYYHCTTQNKTWIASFHFVNDYLDQYLPTVGESVYFSYYNERIDNVVSAKHEQEFIERQIQKRLEKLDISKLHSWRFPLYTVWRGHTLHDSDIPKTFKKNIETAIKKFDEILDSDKYSDELKDELLFFLSFFGNDMPNNAKERIREIIQQEKWGQYYHHIENAISVYDTEWKQQILKQVTELLEAHNIIAIKILATICWRSESNVFAIQLSNERLSILFAMSEKFIQKLANFDKRKIENLLKIDKKKFENETLEPITACLELLLALIRLRKSPDEKLKRLLTPRAEITRQFLELLDKLTRVLNEKHLTLKSQLQLQIDKSLEHKDIPDLIYALQFYLSGETGTNTIRIIGVKED